MSEYWEQKVREAIEQDPEFTGQFELPDLYLSVSSINEYWTCPQLFYLRRVVGITSPRAGALALGSAVHKALELAFLTVKKTGTMMPVEAYEAAYSDSFEKNGEDVEDWDGIDPGQAKDKGLYLLRLYRQQVMHLVRPLEVEVEFVKIIDHSVPLVGRIDLIDGGLPEFAGVEPDVSAAINPAPETEIVDFKTSGQKYSADKIENDFQTAVYSQMHGIARTRFDLLVKTKTPYVYQARGVKTASQGRWAEQLVKDVAMGISRGYFPRCSPDTWRCRPGKCPGWDRCRGAA